MKQRRTFDGRFKAQVVLEVLTGVKSAAQICRQHGSTFVFLFLDQRAHFDRILRFSE